MSMQHHSRLLPAVSTVLSAHTWQSFAFLCPQSPQHVGKLLWQGEVPLEALW